MCAVEKVRIMSTGTITEVVSAYNNVVIEFQGCLNEIINSFTFNDTIIAFINLLKENLPEDFTIKMNKENIVYLKMVIICLKKVLKVAQSQHECEKLKSFPLLYEMQKLFKAHPPEKLRQNLPSLAILDQVYRTLRETADSIIEINLPKSIAFIKWMEESSATGSFLKYVKTMIARVTKRNSEIKIVN